MASSIKTVLELEDKKIKASLKELETYMKKTYGDMGVAIDEASNATDKLNKEKLLLAKTTRQLSLATEAYKKVNKSTKDSDIASAQALQKRIDKLKRASIATKEAIKIDTIAISKAKSKISATRSETAAIKESIASKKKATTTNSNLTNSVVRHLRQIETLVVAYYALSTAWSATAGKGIEINKMMEDNKSGIAALLSANTQMILSNGEVVNSYEKFKIGQGVATKAMQDLREASVKTYATFPQLTQLFQQSIGHTLGMGDAFGETTDAIIKNTIKLTQRISNIAGSIGMEMQKAQEEIRSLLSGNVSTDSLIAVMLFGTPTKANEAMKEAKTRGVNGVKNMLDGMLKPFDVLANVDSYTRAILDLQNSWGELVQDLSKPLFDSLGEEYRKLSTVIKENKDDIVLTMDKLTDYYTILSDILTPAIKETGNTLAELRTSFGAVGEVITKISVPALSAFSKLIVNSAILIQDIVIGIEGLKNMATMDAKEYAVWEKNAKARLKANNQRISSLSDIADGIDNTYTSLDKMYNKTKELNTEEIKSSGLLRVKFKEDSKRLKLVAAYVFEKTKIEKLNGKIIESENGINKKANYLNQLYMATTKDKEKQLQLNALIKKTTNEINLEMLYQAKINKEITEEKQKIADEKQKELQKIADEKQKIADEEQKIADKETKNRKTAFDDIVDKVGKEQKALEDKNKLIEEATQRYADAMSTIYEKSIEGDMEATFTYKLGNQLNKLAEDGVAVADLLSFKDKSTEEFSVGLSIDSLDSLDSADSKMNNIINSQISLARTGLNWGNSLRGVAKDIANVSKAFSKMQITKLKSEKLDNKFQLDNVKRQKTFAKAFLSAEGDKQKQKTLSLEFDQGTAEFEEGQAKLKTARGEAEMAGYASLAGAMASAFEQGSAGAIAFTTLQATLGIASSWTAIAEAWALPYPANIPAVALVTANVMPIIAQLSAMGGGGGSSMSPTLGESFGTDSEASTLFTSANVDTNTSLEQALSELTSTIKIQNKLFEASGLFGGKFANDLKENTVDLLQEIPKIWNDQVTTQTFDFLKQTYGTFNIGNLTTTETSSLGSTTQQFNSLIDMVAGLSDFSEAFPETARLFSGGDTWVSQVIADTESKFKVVLDNYASNLIDLADEMNNYRDSWIDIYESATKDNKFALAEQEKANKDVAELISITDSTSYADMLDKLINVYKIDYAKLREAYKDSDPTVLINELSGIFPQEIFNPENIYNYISAIELVGEAITKSTDNIIEWTRRNETAEEKATRLADALGVGVAGSIQELDRLATDLIASNNLLTDAELELLNANEDFLSSVKETSKAFLSLADANTIISDDIVNQFNSANDSLVSLSETFQTLTNSIEETIFTLLGGSNAADAQTRLVEEFWSKRAEVENLMAKDGKLTKIEEKRLKDLTGDLNKLSLEIQKSAIGDNTKITNELVNELGILSGELDSDQKSLSISETIQDLTQTAVEYLGADSDIVAWLKTLDGSVNDIDFATYTKQNETEAAYLLAFDNLSSTLISKAYQDVLGREADTSGANYWQTQVDSGSLAKSEIGQTLGASAVVGGELSRENYVTQLYTKGLGRTPTAEEVNYWANDSITPTTDLASLFSEIDPSFKAFAKGGVVNQPTLSLFGEAGTEAFVPLPDGRSIPVTMNNQYPSVNMLKNYADNTKDEKIKELLTEVIEKLDRIATNSNDTKNATEQMAYQGVTTIGATA